MKKKILVTTLIISFTVLNNVKARLPMKNSLTVLFETGQYNDTAIKDVSTMKKLVLSNLKTNTQKDFTKRYSIATDVQWYAANDGGFIAKFNDGIIKTIVAYNKAGNWVYTIRHYNEKEMPQEVRAIVKPVYYDYDIVGVQEINDQTNPNSVFIVYVQDKTTLKTLRICDNQMDELNSCKRGDK